jgi:hypothetical protein
MVIYNDIYMIGGVYINGMATIHIVENSTKTLTAIFLMVMLVNGHTTLIIRDLRYLMFQ